MKTIYKVYGHNRQFGWEKLETTPDKDKAFKTATGLTGKQYFSCMIIKDGENGDEIIYRNDFSKECKVEFVDEVKTKVEVKATTFKPSRMKRKEEDRKIFKAYFEGRDKDYGDDDYLNY